MSKAPAPLASAPMAIPPSGDSSRSPLAQVLPQSQGVPPLVVKWNNDVQDSELPAKLGDPGSTVKVDADGKALPAGRAKDGKFIKASEDKPADDSDDIAKPVDGGEPVPEEKGEPVTETPPADEPTQPDTPAAKRAAAMVALQAESRARRLESELKSEREARKADREAREALEAKVKSGRMSDFLALRGVSKTDLEEMIIRGDKELDDVPATGAARKDPEVVALQARLDAMEKELNTRKEAEGQENVRTALARIADDTKDLDIPVVRAADAYELVMRTAWEMWQNVGREGRMADHVPEAAKRAEAHLRAERPALAALADKARGAKPESEIAPKDAAEAAPAARSISRRNGSRPEARTESLWKRGKDGQTPSREEADLIIKREFGLHDKPDLS